MLETKENAHSNDNTATQVGYIIETQDIIPPPAKRRQLEAHPSSSSLHPMKFKSREFFVPAVLSVEGFQRLFKSITGMEFFPCWKPAKKSTRFIFRKTDALGTDCFMYNDECMDAAKVTERIMVEHRKSSREPITIEVRSRHVREDIYISDLPPKFTRKAMEGAILDETFMSSRALRCIFVPEVLHDSWLVQTLYPFATSEQERLFALQVPQWAKQKKKRLDLIKQEIARLQKVDRSPSSVTYLARLVAVSMVQGVTILLNGSVRCVFPNSGRILAPEIQDFAQALEEGPEKMDLLPDQRFESWDNYAQFFENVDNRITINKLHSKEVLHGGASFLRLTKECEASVRFARPELPETVELLYDHLREHLLQGGGVTRPTWRNLTHKILTQVAQPVLQQRIKYVSCRNQWFLMEHKTHVVAWLCTLSGSSDEFNYPAVYMKHAQVLQERKDILQVLYENYDQVIGKLATTFERSFFDVLTAIFADLPGFFARMKHSWELEPVDSKTDMACITDGVSVADEERTNVLLLKPIKGYKCQTLVCDPRKIDDQNMCLTFGRNETNQYVEADPRVSGNHFAIRSPSPQAEGSSWILIDRSSNGTWITRDKPKNNENGQFKIGKGNEILLYQGDIINVINPNATQQQGVVGFMVAMEVRVDGLSNKSRASSASRVLREMRRTKDSGSMSFEADFFSPMMLEEYLPRIASMILRGFDLLRTWVAEQVPLFIEAFFRHPLESRLLDIMSQIQIEACLDLPEIDAKIRKLQTEETDLLQLIQDLQERRVGAMQMKTEYR